MADLLLVEQIQAAADAQTPAVPFVVMLYHFAHESALAKDQQFIRGQSEPQRTTNFLGANGKPLPFPTAPLQGADVILRGTAGDQFTSIPDWPILIDPRSDLLFSLGGTEELTDFFPPPTAVCFANDWSGSVPFDAPFTVDEIFDDGFECGDTSAWSSSDAFSQQLTTQQVDPRDVYVVVSSKLDGVLPETTDDRHFIFGFVFDGDGDPGNNFNAAPGFALDFFQNTDQWYQVEYHPNSGWRILRRDVVAGGAIQSASTGARAFILGDAVVILIPRREFAVPAGPLGFRTSAFTYLSSDPFGLGAGTAAGDTLPGPLDDLATIMLP